MNTAQIRARSFRTQTTIYLFLLTVTAASCSSGGDVAGFCRRWDRVLERTSDGSISSTSELLDAVSADKLGDPGGTLSSMRQGFENAIQNGTNEEALQYTQMISDYCSEVENG